MAEDKDQDKRDINVLNSMLMIALDSNAVLNACLEVLMGIRMEGKTPEEKEAYEKKMNDRLKELRKQSQSLLFRIDSTK